MSIIKPARGLHVLFTPLKGSWHSLPTDDDGRCLAIIVKVWGDRMVNLSVFDANGKSEGYTSIKLIQDGDEKPADGGYCEWPTVVSEVAGAALRGFNS